MTQLPLAATSGATAHCDTTLTTISMVRRGSTPIVVRCGYFLLLHSGHGHCSQPQPVHASRIMARFTRLQLRPPAQPGARRDRLAGVATAVAAPAFAAFLDRHGGDEQCRGRVHPPEPKDGVRAKTDQERDRQV